MIHDARVIPTDGRPPLQSAHKEFMGESRGHWEGNTLVVETTNYKGRLAPMINLAVVDRRRETASRMSDQMKTTERITRLNDNMWLYEIKTEIPSSSRGRSRCATRCATIRTTSGGNTRATRATRIVPNYIDDVALRAREPADGTASPIPV